MTLILANASVIDCVRPGVAAGAAVTIDDGRITRIADRPGPIDTRRVASASAARTVIASGTRDRAPPSGSRR